MPSIKSSVVIFEVKLASKNPSEVISRGHLHYENIEVHTWFEVNNFGYYHSLQRSMAHMGYERKLEYVVVIMR